MWAQAFKAMQPDDGGQLTPSSSHSIDSRGVGDDEVDQLLWSSGIDVEEVFSCLAAVPILLNDRAVEAAAGFVPKEVLPTGCDAELGEAVAGAGCESGHEVATVVGDPAAASPAADAAAGWTLEDSDEDALAVL